MVAERRGELGVHVHHVVVRFVLPAPPGRNSLTVPATATSWPTFTAGADEVNTNNASCP
jgi:hypothetical protein